MQNMLFLLPRENALDNDDIKKAIMNYGAVYSSLMVQDDCFDKDMSCYYLPENRFDERTVGGHAITIIGWDDTYSRRNFVYRPAGDGAFLCKNSWGKGAGEKGYFYLSYYDTFLNFGDVGTAFYGLESVNNYGKIYQYDPLGPIDTLESEEKNVLTVANVFPQKGKTLTAQETVCAASFYTIQKGVQYEIFVVSNYKNDASLSAGKRVASGMLPYAGYHTIDFSGVTVKKGARFAVVVKLTNPAGDGIGTFLESPMEEYSSKARANAGESYFRYNDEDWADMTKTIENTNLCVKAFTKKTSSSGAQAQFAVDNESRSYTSSKVYSAKELAALGVGLSKTYLDAAKTGGSIGGLRVVSASLPRNNAEKTKGKTLPAKLDLRDSDCVSPTKNQKFTGTCWAFAACASMESCMLKRDAGLTNQVGSKIYSVSTSDKTVNYKQTFQPEFTVDADAGKDYSVTYESSDPSVIAVRGNALYSAGVGTAEITVTVTGFDGSKAQDTCRVTSKYTFWQQLIRIFLLGFLWY